MTNLSSKLCNSLRQISRRPSVQRRGGSSLWGLFSLTIVRTGSREDSRIKLLTRRFRGCWQASASLPQQPLCLCVTFHQLLDLSSCQLLICSLENWVVRLLCRRAAATAAFDSDIGEVRRRREGISVKLSVCTWKTLMCSGKYLKGMIVMYLNLLTLLGQWRAAARVGLRWLCRSLWTYP